MMMKNGEHRHQVITVLTPQIFYEKIVPFQFLTTGEIYARYL